MQFSSSEFTLLPQSTSDKHLWTMAAICWVFQSILSWNWLALYEKYTENCHAYQGKSSHNSAFFFVHLQLWMFFGGYIEMCSRIYILDCISCNLFWSYWQFANKNSKQDATVYSFRTVGSDFGIHECTRKGATAEKGGVLLLILLWNIIWAIVWWISWNMEEIWTKGFTWLPLFCPTLEIMKS